MDQDKTVELVTNLDRAAIEAEAGPDRGRGQGPQPGGHCHASRGLRGHEPGRPAQARGLVPARAVRVAGAQSPVSRSWSWSSSICTTWASQPRRNWRRIPNITGDPGEQTPDVHRWRVGRTRLRPVVRKLQPVYRRALGADRARQQSRCRSRRSHRPRGLHRRTLAADDAEPARRLAAQAWRSRRAQRGAAGRDRSAGQRQADRRDARASSTTCRSGTTTSAGSPTKSKAASFRWTRRATSTSPATSRWAWWWPSRPGIRRCCSPRGSSRRRSPPATPW